MPPTPPLLSSQPGHAPPAPYQPPSGGHQPGAGHYSSHPNPGSHAHSYPAFPSALTMSQAPSAPFPLPPNRDGTTYMNQPTNRPHMYQYNQPLPYPTPPGTQAPMQDMSVNQQHLQDNIDHLQARLEAQETANQIQQARLEAQEATFRMQQERIESATLAQQERLIQQDKMIKDLQVNQYQKAAKESKGPTKPAVSAFIHKIMLRLLGVTLLRRGKLPSLPRPLDAGEPSRKAQDGTDLHNPDWTVGLLAPTSRAFIEMAAALALQQEQATPTCSLPAEELNLKTFQVAAKQYFTQLRKSYKAQNSPGTRRKQDIHRMQSRRRSRKSQKADMCRAAIPTIIEKHGKENVVGIENIFETDNMTSEYSQEEGGLLSERSWAAHKAKFVKGNIRAFEQRRKMWKSSDHRRLQMYAFSIGREIALPENGKNRELAQIPRFPCDNRNVNDEPPKARRLYGKPVYEKCVSQSWLARTRSPMVLEAMPPSFTVFNIAIPDNLFRSRDLQYLQEHNELEQELKAQADHDAEYAADDEGEPEA
ncbi:hypothetical protein HYPSUDRAFT_200339 [Hypholoma sublateritium FD-334 SS-4]|uniref:Uncharacterized protein n=1 Tax=Hypholoma sublateritium (strain FD-334 SS-4) TaxID=945553 RepID=A0A0D2P830_HYPSF|nr:hypothetical protein HYPSUDRAFT_200339 [Hypholoma sublateritium FD-334 SS-4]